MHRYSDAYMGFKRAVGDKHQRRGTITLLYDRQKAGILDNDKAYWDLVVASMLF